ncbi:MAG: elongation factor G [Actinomycetota bacterium]|nr:elongation factor G [Actinomycetota bacterium]
MKKYATKNIRNLALVGHGGSGKTTLAEAMLFITGAITRFGKVDEGNTTTDYDPEEIRRKFSINTSLAPCEWNNHKINVVDTPGYADFIGEVYSALSAVDIAAIVVDAVSGLEVQTERVWAIADEFNLAKMVIINRMDKEHASFDETLKVIQEVYSDKVTPLQLPVGSQANFKGVVDVLKQKAYITADGKTSIEGVPADMADAVASAREALIERIAESDDVLMEKYLEEGELSEKEIMDGLKAAIASGQVIPVTCTAAFTAVGVQGLLDAIVDFLPSPIDRGAIKGIDSKSDQEIEIKPSESEPLAAYVFKTVADPYVGKLSYFRVFSGNLKANSTVFDSSQGKKERVGHVFVVRGKTQEDVSDIPAGDIGAVAKLAETMTGDTLTEEGRTIILPAIKFPEPVISVAVAAKSKSDEEKLGTSLNRLAEEDPTLTVKRDTETRQTVLSGMGDMHLDIITERLKRKFGVEAELSAPRIPYKETIKGTASVQGRHKKQSGGRGQFGDVWLKIEPLPRGAGFEFVDQIVGGVVPQQYRPAVEKGVREAMEQGILAGYPAVDVKVTLYDGSYHAVDSSEMAFKIAGSLAMKKGFMEAKPVLLEPIMKVEVVVPEQYMGDVIGDLSSRRGKPLGSESRGRNVAISALVPLAEMATYASSLRSITSGRGAYHMEFDHYEEVPADTAKKIIEQYEKERAAGS